MKENELPEKYKTCDWLWNYGSIGLSKEHIKRLNNAINIFESLNEHTDAKYLKEIKDKLLEDTPEIKPEKTNTDAFIEKVCEFISFNIADYIDVTHHGGIERVELQERVIEEFRKYMEGE